MRRKLRQAIPAAVAVATLLSPLGAAASAGPAAPLTGSVDQPLDYGPPGTVPTGRIAPPPSQQAQDEMRSRPVTPVSQPTFP